MSNNVKSWIDRSFPHLCDVEKPASTQSLSGQVNQTWPDDDDHRQKGVPCHFFEQAQSEPSSAESDQLSYPFVMTLPMGTTITTQHRITNVRNRENETVYAGTFDVEEVRNQRGARGNTSHVAVGLEIIN